MHLLSMHASRLYCMLPAFLQASRLPKSMPCTLKIKSRWESNINGWFPFMYSQKWNCYYKNIIIMFCLPVTTFQDRSAYSAAWKYVDRSWEYITCSQTHECGNWDWGHAIPRKGIHKWDFPCSACQTNGLANMPILSLVLRHVACMFFEARRVTFISW